MVNVITAKREKKDRKVHKNWMGGNSWDISNPVTRLHVAATSCFFGEPMYYHRDEKRSKTLVPLYRRNLIDRDLAYLKTVLGEGLPNASASPVELMEKAIDEALDVSPEATLQLAAFLRVQDHIRTTPQVIMVRAAHHPKVRGTGLVRRYASEIIRRADEPAVQLAYHIFRYGEKAPIPNALKKAWRDTLASFNDYQLAKYRTENGNVKAVDVVNLCHANSPSVAKLMTGQLKTTNETWEAIVSAEGSNTEAWTKALDVMGHMALLRNLRNLSQKGVPEALYLQKLVDGAPTGQQLPFRYYSAYLANRESSGNIQDAIEKCMVSSLGNLPHFKGRVMSLCDNSGSAWGTTTSSMGTMHVAQIANLTGVITGMVSDDGHIGIFGDNLITAPIRKGSSIFDQTRNADKLGQRVGGSTENGIWLFWDKAIKEKVHWDHVFVYSDMQAGHGGLYGVNPRDYNDYLWNGSKNIDVPKLINKYRATVNPNVNVYLVQVAGYQDIIVPEFYNRTYILGGWGEGILKFAARMAELRGDQ